jgi:hypothetical protein
MVEFDFTPLACRQGERAGFLICCDDQACHLLGYCDALAASTVSFLGMAHQVATGPRADRAFALAQHDFQRSYRWQFGATASCNREDMASLLRLNRYCCDPLNLGGNGELGHNGHAMTLADHVRQGLGITHAKGNRRIYFGVSKYAPNGRLATRRRHQEWLLSQFS